MLIDGLILADISCWQRPCLITFYSMFAYVCKGLRIMILTKLLIATRKYKSSKLNWECFQNVVLLGRKFIVIPVGASVQKSTMNHCGYMEQDLWRNWNNIDKLRKCRQTDHVSIGKRQYALRVYLLSASFLCLRSDLEGRGFTVPLRVTISNISTSTQRY